MVSKKRHSSAVEESDGEKRIKTSKSGMGINTYKCKGENVNSALLQSLNPMERKKKRKLKDKEKNQIDLEANGTLEPKTTHENTEVSQIGLPSSTTSVRPGIHLDLLLHLASANLSVREAAAEMLVTESIDVQKAYEGLENRVEAEGNLLLEAEKDDGLEDCAPSLRLLVNRLILGTSSTRECARQGFSLGLAVVLEKIPAVEVESVMRLINNKLKVPSGMKGQEARDLLLGQLFAYGSLARSHRLSSKWISDKNTSVIMEFTSTLISLAQKKRYLHEPAIAVILDMLEKLPLEAIERHVLIAPGINEWLQKAVETGDPDALFFALKLQEMVSMKRETFNKLIPHPFNIENFFSRENLQILGRCFKERDVGPGLLTNELHSMRYLLIQLVLQILLHPNDFSEAASDLSICCNKLFLSTLDNDSEEAFDDNDMPKLMDVLVETLLSVLPHSSARMSYVVDQVFRIFCGDITDYGLQRMLRVVKKDLKPLRHPVSSDDDEEDDEDDEVLGIEDTEMDETKADEVSSHEENEDDSVKMSNAGETTSSSEDESAGGELAGVEHKLNVGKSGENPHKLVKPVEDKARDTDSEDFDDSDGGMDDDAMFRMDAYHAQLLKERTGNDSALSQLILFKLRVLTLLEIYLQNYPGKSHVLAISSCLVQTYSKYHGVGGNEQLGQRIIGILKKKIFRGKDYPRGDDIPLDTLEKLLDRSLKTASRSRVKDISSLAQASAFWLLKIINSRNFADSELARVVLIIENVLVDYFNNRNSRLKSGFIKEVIKRFGSLGLKLFAFLLDKCANAKSEFRRIEAVDMVDCIIKSVIPNGKDERDKGMTSKSSKLLKTQLPVLCKVILQLLNNLPGKQSRRAEVRRFCAHALEAVAALNLKKSFIKAMKPDGISVCESKLGNAVAPFKAL